MRSTTRPRLALVALAATTLMLATAVTSGARDGASGDSGGGDGYTVEVSVTYTGDGAPGSGGGSHTVVVRAACWWSSEIDDGVDGGDAEAVQQWVDEQYSGGHHSGAEWVRTLGPRERFEKAVEDWNDDEDMSWYRLQCQDSVDSDLALDYAPNSVSWPNGPDSPRIVEAWQEGTEPEPAVDPEVLAEAARQDMVIAAPEVDRNPRSAALGGATMVNLPTWFWVTDPAAVGGEDGTRTIRAEIADSPVYAEVTAKTGGLSVSSASGSAECPPEVALRQWSPGAANSTGCTVEFARASVGQPDGFPVTAATQWDATWEGQTQGGDPVGGDLESLSRETSITVPVAEIQGIVEAVQ